MKYNAIARVHATLAHADDIVDALVDYSPAVGFDHDEAIITITLPAKSLDQAVRTGLAVIGAETRRRVTAIEVLPTRDFDRRYGA
jgi:hypothetical protein